MDDYYRRSNANIHRGIHTLAEEATALYEEAREIVASFINAPKARQLIFTRNTTESINLVAQTWGRANLNPGDVVILTEMEHHSNLVPWQMLAVEKNLQLEFVPVNPQGYLELEVYERLLRLNPKLVAFTHMSNVLGTINPAEEMTQMAHDSGAIVLIDGAQSVPHFPVDIDAIGADFLVFSGHKMFSPMGIGGVVLSRELVDKLPPFLYGGDMIEFVEGESSTYREGYEKFEGGTHNVEGIVGLGAAIDFMEGVGLEKIRDHKMELHDYAIKKLKDKCWVDLYHASGDKAAVLAFNIKGVHPHDVSQILDLENVCIRTGHHCAQPLMKHLGIPSCCRISFSIYNTKKDIDKLTKFLREFQL